MGAFNLDNYTPVEERIGMFYGDCPTGRILTTIERLDPPLCVIRAEVYRNSDELRPWATGYAYEMEGGTNVNRTSYIENCETSAIGRALANAGYHGKREGSPRPSREEMEKVERMNGQHVSNECHCPKCGGVMYDNRADKPGPAYPDFKCKDKKCLTNGKQSAFWWKNVVEQVSALATTAVGAGLMTPEKADDLADLIAKDEAPRVFAAWKMLDLKLAGAQLAGMHS